VHAFSEFVSEHVLITAAAYASLLLTVSLVLWCAELIHAVWSSTKNAIRDVLDFRRELRQRKAQELNHSP
jgi:hypothetical protein